MNKNKKKYILNSILISTMFLSIGCTNTNTTTQQSEVATETKSINGEVIAITDNKMTIKVGTVKLKDNAAPPAKPDSNEEPPAKPSEKQDTDTKGKNNPRRENGEKPNKKEEALKEPDDRNMLEFTGEEITVEVKSDVKIKEISSRKADGTNQKEEKLSLSDIRIGDLVAIEYKEDGKTLNSIEVIFVNDK